MWLECSCELLAPRRIGEPCSKLLPVRLPLWSSEHYSENENDKP